MTDSNRENALSAERLSDSSKRNISFMVELRDVANDLSREINQTRDIFYKIHNSSQVIARDFSDDAFSENDALAAERAIKNARHDSFSVQSDLISAITRAEEALLIIRNIKSNRESALDCLQEVR